MTIREKAIKYLWAFVQTWYSWGGDDPSGIDCSGLICEILQALGLIPRSGPGSDLTAQGIWDKFRDKIVEKPYEGCLVFYYGSDPNIAIHIEMCIDDESSIGASGGGSKTITKEDAIRDNAFVKMRPIRSRDNIKGFIDLFK